MKLIQYIVEKHIGNILVFVKIQQDNKNYIKELGSFIFDKHNRNWVFIFNTNDDVLKEEFKLIKIEDLHISNLNYFELPEFSTNYVEIPTNYLFIFKQDKFIVKDFIIELTTKDNKKYVNTSYLQWAAFSEELDKPENMDLNRALNDIWVYVATQIQNNNLITI